MVQPAVVPPVDLPPPGETPPPQNLTARTANRLRAAGLQQYALFGIATVVVVGALKAAPGFFVPVVFAIVIALALAPLVRRLQRVMPRWIASALVVTSLVSLLGFMAYSLSDEASQAIAGLPQATRTLRQTFRAIVNRGEGALSQLQRAATELERTASESTKAPTTLSGVTPVQVVEPPVDFTNLIWSSSQGVFAFTGNAALAAFLVYFLLASGDLFKLKFVKLSGDQLSRRKVTVQLIDQIGDRVAKSMFHLILAGIVVGVCTWAILVAFGVQYPGLWGLAAGLLNFIPYLGPAVVAAGLLLACLLQFGDPATALMVSGISLVVTTLESSLFTPIIFGKSVQLNPVAIFVSFLFWAWVWGVAGMLLALPLLIIIKTIAESIEDLAPLAELLSD